ncbi:helix-turn-helix domain-containing protein [Stenotrophomonas sp. PD6]|uniref:helix-turn-helix domain-containing protein n=1 Tax=Stenotrophomonas sp. PD6 TaxID=3368612 RepID=UPI003B9F2582
MPAPEFADLLSRHMRRIRASAGGVAAEIGISREAVNNWRAGTSRPSRRHRDRVLACANYLRLTEAECNALLQSVGFEPEFPVEPASALPVVDTVAGTVPATVTRLFDRLQQLRPYPVSLLLTQAHWGQPPERAAILAEAAARYGQERVLHLQPPFRAGEGDQDYFALLAAQCGLDGVTSDAGFEMALARRLQQSGALFCLVSRFEQGAPGPRDVLAGILRSLSEMYSGKLHLLICGGAALADLKYQGGDLSLLNIAATESWPELGVDDLRRSAAGVADATLSRALQLSGGHPLLAQAAVLLLADTALDDEAVIDALSTHPRLWESLLPMLRDVTARDAVRGWLARSPVAPARPYLMDPLLRQLYWSNLLTSRAGEQGAGLEWRCEAIRRAVRQVIDGLEALPA